MKQTLLYLLLLVSVLFTLTAFNQCGGPIPPVQQEPAVVQPDPVVPPAPVAPPALVIVTPKVVVSKPIIYVDKKDGSFSLNKKGLEMLKSGRYVTHINYDYIYNIGSITASGDEILEYHDWYPKSIKKVTIGLYDTVTGKYVVSVRAI